MFVALTGTLVATIISGSFLRNEWLTTPLANSFYFHVVFSIFLVKPYSFNFAFCLPM